VFVLQQPGAGRHGIGPATGREAGAVRKKNVESLERLINFG